MSIFTVVPVLPRVCREADTLVFNSVPSYAEVSQVVSGAAAYTTFGAPVYSNDGLRLATTVIMRIVAQGSCHIRPVSFYWENGLKVWNRTYPEVVPGPGPSNLGSVMTSMWNATWGDANLRAYEHFYTLEVYGSGKIYEVQLEIDYQQAA